MTGENAGSGAVWLLLLPPAAPTPASGHAPSAMTPLRRNVLFVARACRDASAPAPLLAPCLFCRDPRCQEIAMSHVVFTLCLIGAVHPYFWRFSCASAVTGQGPKNLLNGQEPRRLILHHIAAVAAYFWRFSGTAAVTAAESPFT